MNIPADDPICAVVDSIVELASVDHWGFARFKHFGADHDQQLLSTDGMDVIRFSRLRAEFEAQRRTAARGPRLSAPAIAGERCAVGVTMIFADQQHEFGILLVWRNAGRPPFASAEIRLLTMALHASCDRLSTARLLESCDAGPEIGSSAGRETEREHERGDDSVMYVLDRIKLDIVLTCSSNAHSVASSDDPRRLPAVLERAVRTLTADWTADPKTHVQRVAQPCAPLRLRTQPLGGDQGTFIGVLVERVREGNAIAHAAAAFAISPRESQVLAHLLAGFSLLEIANAMHITSSTVQDHLKSVLHKTNAQNRSAMIAKILGWNAHAHRSP